jgi:hypothetical protein
LPDWLSGLQDEPTQSQAPQKPAPPPAAESDWFSAMTPEATPAAKPAPADSQPASESAFGGDLSDWLSNLDAQTETPALKFTGDTLPLPSLPNRQPEKATEEHPLSAQPASGGLTDWLSGMRTESPTPASATPIAADLSDWLSGLEQQPAAGRPDLPATSELPDWLSGTPAVTKPAEVARAEQPAPIQSAAIKPAIEPATSDETQDWLSGLTGGAQSAELAASQPGAVPLWNDPAAEDTLPDWLSTAIGDKPDLPPAAPSKPKPPKPTKAFPTGTLADMPQPSETPEWLAGLQAPPSSDASAWLGALAAETPKTAEPARPAPADDASPFGDFAFGDLAATSDLPDWMSSISETASPESSQSAASSDAASPGHLPSLADGQGLDSMFSDDVPDWLSNFTPSEIEAAPLEAQPEVSDSNLGQVELPSWVQAMRPMESMLSADAGGDDDQASEQTGPLAGLRNVLPPRVDPLEIRKSKTYSIRLQVTSTQQSQMALMQKLVESEAVSQPITTPKRVQIIRPLRWIIAGVLFLAVLLPALLGSKALSLPYIYPPETSVVRDIVDGLPESAPVLVVFDYQPGYAGEMESAAAPIIDHLMLQKALLSFVASSPSGVLMGERMMTLQNQRRQETGQALYKIGAQYVDLGYLPGGAAGIQVFAMRPKVTLGRDAVFGDLWALPALQGVNQLSDFAAVIVLTDNPDTGRMWVEQAGPALVDTPLLMVISAQAEPMIRPYYTSGQLRGMVIGLEGGAMYENLIQRPEQARQYWDSYGAAMIASEMLIVIGGAWALITGLRERRANQEEDEA